MIRFLNKSVIMLTIVAAFFTVSCEKVETPVVEYLEVNASNLHGNWVLKSINDSPVQDGACFYINFNRSGNEYTIWETMTSIPSTPNVDKGTFAIYTDPELGAYIRGIDEIGQEWSDRYVIKDLTKTTMTWVGVNDSGTVQKFERVDEVPFEK